MDSNKRSKEFHCDLKEAYFPAVKTEEILNTTIGEELRKASIDSGSMMALVQVQDDGSLGRSWTYEELYKDVLSWQSECLHGTKKEQELQFGLLITLNG